MLGAAWSKVIWACLLIYLLAAPSYAQSYDFADHVTLTRSAPGSVIVRYTGIRGLVYNQSKSQLLNLHKDYLELYHPPKGKFFRKSRLRMHQEIHDIENGGKWWTRKWWHSFMPENGGAPKYPKVYISGPKSHLLIDIGLAYLTSEFKFKLREYKVNISKVLDASTSLTYIPPYNWSLRVRPSLKFSSTELIRRGRLSLFFEYSHMRTRLISVEFFLGYSRRRGGSIGFRISFLQF